MSRTKDYLLTQRTNKSVLTTRGGNSAPYVLPTSQSNHNSSLTQLIKSNQTTTSTCTFFVVASDFPCHTCPCNRPCVKTRVGPFRCREYAAKEASAAAQALSELLTVDVLNEHELWGLLFPNPVEETTQNREESKRKSHRKIDSADRKTWHEYIHLFTYIQASPIRSL